MALSSLVEALGLAASRVLQIDEGELSGWWTPVMGGRADEAQLYLYDLLPGGAGYARTVEEAKAWWRSAAGDSMLARLGRQHAVVDPTLAAYRAVAMSETAGPPRDAWMNTFRFLEELTGRMHRAGITLLAGSDYVSPAEGLVPGKSILEEIQLLEESGLTHREAVDAASVNITNWLKKR